MNRRRHDFPREIEGSTNQFIVVSACRCTDSPLFCRRSEFTVLLLATREDSAFDFRSWLDRRRCIHTDWPARGRGRDADGRDLGHGDRRRAGFPRPPKRQLCGSSGDLARWQVVGRFRSGMGRRANRRHQPAGAVTSRAFSCDSSKFAVRLGLGENENLGCRAGMRQIGVCQAWNN